MSNERRAPSQLTDLEQQMLGIIAERTLRTSYLATWHLCDALGVDRAQIGAAIPGTDYDVALATLLRFDLVEELPDLPCRYRLRLPRV